MILDHLTISVSDFARAKAFYERALKPLGIKVIMEFDGFAGMGKERPQFWFAAGETYYGAFVFDPDGYNVEAVCHTAS